MISETQGKKGRERIKSAWKSHAGNEGRMMDSILKNHKKKNHKKSERR